MQDLDVKISFQLTNTIIQENFTEIFKEPTRMDNLNIDTLQSSLKALPTFKTRMISF
jgi:hypothetical protein